VDSDNNSDSEYADDTICFCNKVSASTVKNAIKAGASTLPKIYDACQAGNGPCGGSCREDIKALLRHSSATTTKEVEKIPPALVKGISLFNRHYFWECHEVLEHEWLEENGPNRLFYQGIIQASAAMYHVLNANPKGCIRLAAEARKKLQPYSPKFMQVPLVEFLQRLEEFEITSKEILGGTKSGYDYDRIPKLILGTSMNEI